MNVRRRLPKEQWHQEIAKKADEIEAELKGIGYWQAGPLPPERAKFKEAFATDTMAFSEWLQHVFLPRVRECLKTGEFPASSHVAVQAIREYMMWGNEPETERLIDLLKEFDALFN